MSKSRLEILDHILVEIEFLQTHREDLTEAKFAADEVRQRAFVRSLEIIGEAVKGIDDTLKNKHPEINWKEIAGMRDKLIHHYFGVDYNLVWDVIENKIDKLKSDLEHIKKQNPSRSS